MLCAHAWGRDVHDADPEDGGEGYFLCKRQLQLPQQWHGQDDYGQIRDEVDDANCFVRLCGVAACAVDGLVPGICNWSAEYHGFHEDGHAVRDAKEHDCVGAPHEPFSPEDLYLQDYQYSHRSGIRGSRCIHKDEGWIS